MSLVSDLVLSPNSIADDDGSKFCHIYYIRSRKLAVFNVILIIYIALSYVPQIYKIVIRKSTHGISPGYIFLSVCFSTSAFGFSLFLHRNAYECWYWMGALSGLQAVEALLGLIQAGTLWVGSWIILILYVRYNFRSAARMAVFLYLGFSILVSAIALIPNVLHFFRPHPTGKLAFLDEVFLLVPDLFFANLFAILLPIPQIRTIYILRSTENLSIATLVMEAFALFCLTFGKPYAFESGIINVEGLHFLFATVAVAGLAGLAAGVVLGGKRAVAEDEERVGSGEEAGDTGTREDGEAREEGRVEGAGEQTPLLG